MPRLLEAKLNVTRFAEACGLPDADALRELGLQDENQLPFEELLQRACREPRNSPERRRLFWQAAAGFIEHP